MKEPIVYLPVPHRVPDSAGLPSDQAYTPLEVFEALEAAGVQWVMEDPKDYQIRMMKLQIEELKSAYVEIQDQHVELRNVCTTLEDQNAALKMTIRRLEDKA